MFGYSQRDSPWPRLWPRKYTAIGASLLVVTLVSIAVVQERAAGATGAAETWRGASRAGVSLLQERRRRLAAQAEGADTDAKGEEKPAAHDEPVSCVQCPRRSTV